MRTGGEKRVCTNEKSVRSAESEFVADIIDVGDVSTDDSGAGCDCEYLYLCYRI